MNMYRKRMFSDKKCSFDRTLLCISHLKVNVDTLNYENIASLFYFNDVLKLTESPYFILYILFKQVAQNLEGCEQRLLKKYELRKMAER